MAVPAATIEALLETLLHSANDAWRDDAAMELAECGDQQAAKAALLSAMNADILDQSLQRTCAESLATIFHRLRSFDEEAVLSLPNHVQDIVRQYYAALVKQRH